jgi:Primase C terminal 1 (PriCT-1)./Bifunctional DNA primase/polymerase, N-terminal.
MDIKEEVLKLAECGFNVIPCDGKVPVVKNWTNLNSSNKYFVEKYWTDNNYNVGILTGSGIIVIDCDIKPSIDGLANLTQFLIYNNITLPQTLSATTGGGGKHFYYSTTKKITNKTNFLKLDGIDIRGDGGMVIAPPSLHHSGNNYTWDNDCNIAELPKELEDILVNYKEYKKGFTRKVKANDTKEHTTDKIPKTPKKSGKIKQRYKITPYIYEGERNSTLFELGSLLIGTGISPQAIEETLLIENQLKCIPPLEDEEIKQIADSVGEFSLEQKAISKITLLFSGDIPSVSIAIYFYLWVRALQLLERTVYVSQEDIAKCLQLRNPRTIRKYAKLLEHYELIKIGKANNRTGGYSVNCYTLL